MAMDWVNEYFRLHSDGRFSPAMVLHDGTKLSVQASWGHYCSPRQDRAIPYDSVEIGFPSVKIDELMEYAEDSDRPTDTVYGYVPVDVVNKVIESRGGIKNL